MKKTFSICAIATIFLASEAGAATCADREHIVTQLQAQYGETLLANAVSPSNKILEVYGSREKDTWSVFVYLPEDNLSCLAASGDGIKRLLAEMDVKL